MRWVVLVLLLVAACNAPRAGSLPPPAATTNASGENAMDRTSIERVTLTTEDNVTIVGSYYDAPGDGVILLHQLNLDKTSWDPFAKELQRKGYAAIAIDLRGHGESEGKWQSFQDADFQAMLLDADAASTFLQSREKRVAAVIGASIGANTALRYSANHKTPAVLLSPGLAYRGIDINNVTSTAPTLIVVARDDSYSFSSSQELEKNNLFGEHSLLVIEGDKHGTYMLVEDGVADEILGFLANYTAR